MSQPIAELVPQLDQRILALIGFLAWHQAPSCVCSPTFIIVRPNHDEHHFDELRLHQHPTVCREIIVTRVAIVLLTTAVVIVFALMAAAAAGTLARLDGASYPTALMRAAATFAAVITLAGAAAGVLTEYLS
ncbi:hypothetical protein LUW76_30935 [Actinomadura madurae]|uniref:hypothetical protein n=1 Tax=Actinomadura madurae TaxID=1993 RepID=UPI002026432D|nr:hypothetical protein [Actinomadura madurae]URM98407.1 hypothetical protein LUW76_30935 [Actinomadura madurae]